MKKQKMSWNMMLNMMRVLLSIIFPLITFPYISRVLDVDNIGKISFAKSLVSYFSLIAAFGISSYAIREGAGCRNNKHDFEKFANEIFTLNIITSAIACILLVGITLIFPQLHSYKNLIFLEGMVVVFAPLAVDWINNIYEDFLYITIRSILVQIISIVLMFAFVKQQQDYYKYAAISVFSACAANIINYFYVKKYVKLKIRIGKNIIRHFKVTVVFFVNSIASTIYLNSDTTLIGLMCNDTAVGLYSTATKIYSIVKQLINAFAAVTIPRLSYLYKNETQKFYGLVENLINGIIIFSFPAAFGMIIISSDLIKLIAGVNFLGARIALSILSLAIPFAALAYIVANGILIAVKREKSVLLGTMVSAIVNILLNFIIIPIFKQNGAAFTTLIAEVVMLSISCVAARDILRNVKVKKNIIQCGLATILMCLLALVIYNFNSINISVVNILIYIIPCASLYFFVLLVMGNDVIRKLCKSIFNKIKDYKK